MYEKPYNEKQQYREATEYLDNKQAFFLTDVLNIGKPIPSTDLPTAWVSLKYGAVQFGFNPNFAKTLDSDQFGFILAHETLHVLLNHLRLAKSYTDKQAFNVAADCVINDYLAQCGIEPIENSCRGEKIVGYDCADKTVAEVYSTLMQQKNEKGEDDTGDGEGEKGQSKGQGGDSYGDYTDATPPDSHDWIHRASEDEIATAENLSDQNRPQDLDAAKDDGNSNDLMTSTPTNMNWRKLMLRVNPDIFRIAKRRPQWHRTPRKLAGIPDIRLPVYEDKASGGTGDLPAIVLALDTSGSIPQRVKEQFIGLAQSIPQDKIKLFACTFTSVYKVLDINEPRYNGGGTNFSAIEAFIQEKVVPDTGSYPRAVVVVTDGEAYFRAAPKPTMEQLRKNWTWLLTPRASRRYLRYAYPGDEEIPVERLVDYADLR